MKNLEIWQEIPIGQPVSEIPPNPPLEKGGRGDFWQAIGPKENAIPSLRLCQPTNSSRKSIEHSL
jgi:hypothetical protein